MTTTTTLAAALSLSIAATGHAEADGRHRYGDGLMWNDSGPTAGQFGVMQDILQMMMQIHGRMMDGNMIRMMMGPGLMGAGLGVEPEPGAARAAMLARLAEFDADGDGRITEAERGGPARRMEMRRGMPGAPGMMGDRMPSGN